MERNANSRAPLGNIRESLRRDHATPHDTGSDDMASICIIHEEETGEQRPAPHRFSRYVGDGRYQTDPVCEECYRELCSAAGAERHNATLYAYASGERA